MDYRNISDISHSLVGNTIVDHSDVFGASVSGFGFEGNPDAG